MLNGKTRILVTHGISYLPQTDLIVVLDNGTISETGSYQELLQTRGAFSQFLRLYLLEEVPEENETDDPEDVAIIDKIRHEVGADVAPPSRRASHTCVPTIQTRARSMSTTSQISVHSLKKIKDVFRQSSRRLSKTPEHPVPEKKTPVSEPDEKGKLVDIEKSEIGGVKWGVYFMFMNQMSFIVVIGLSVFYGISYGMSVGANFWLGQWALDAAFEDRRNSTEWRDFRLGVYSVFGALQGTDNNLSFRFRSK